MFAVVMVIRNVPSHTALESGGSERSNQNQLQVVQSDPNITQVKNAEVSACEAVVVSS